MPSTGIELMLTVVTGTEFSVCEPGCWTRRRPFNKVRVLPVPMLRKLIEATSPRDW